MSRAVDDPTMSESKRRLRKNWIFQLVRRRDKRAQERRRHEEFYFLQRTAHSREARQRPEDGAGSREAAGTEHHPSDQDEQHRDGPAGDWRERPSELLP